MKLNFMPVMKLRGLPRAKSLGDLPGTGFDGATNLRIEIGAFMSLNTAVRTSVRRITHRTHGQNHGPQAD
jgi:hypothetical protein